MAHRLSCPLFLSLLLALLPAGTVVAQAGQYGLNEVRLEAAATPFTLLHRTAMAPQPRGYVVILPSRGEPVSMVGSIIHSLAETLPLHGWESVVLVLPGLADEDGWHALVEAALRRTLSWLQSAGRHQIAVVGHGQGGVGIVRQAASSEGGIRAVVTIDLSTPPTSARGNAVLGAIERLRLPFYDLHIDRGGPTTETDLEARRAAAARAGNHDYVQLSLLAVGDPLDPPSVLVERRIRGWLERHQEHIGRTPDRRRR